MIYENFFSILTCLSCAVMLVVLPIEIARFPSKVRQIDLSKNKKNKPTKKYFEECFIKLQLRLIAITVCFYAIVSISFSFSSIPQDYDFKDFNNVVAICVLCWIVSVFVGGIVLAEYFMNTAKKISSEKNDLSAGFIQGRYHFVIGAIICFFTGFAIILAIADLLYLLS